MTPATRHHKPLTRVRASIRFCTLNHSIVQQEDYRVETYRKTVNFEAVTIECVLANCASWAKV